MQRGSKLLLAIAAEAVKLYYKFEDAKVSEVLGPVPRLPAPRRRLAAKAFGFPIRVDGEDVPFYACMIYVAGGLILGKNPDELALMLGERPEKAKAMYEEGIKWASKLAYAATRLAHLAKDERAKQAGVKLLSDAFWTALAIYSTTSANTTVYGLFRNVSREGFAPSVEDAERLEKEMQWLFSNSNLEKVMSGEPITPLQGSSPAEEPKLIEENAESEAGGELDELDEAVIEIRRRCYELKETARELKNSVKEFFEKPTKS